MGLPNDIPGSGRTYLFDPFTGAALGGANPLSVVVGVNAAFSGATLALPANTSTKVASAGDRLFAILNVGAGNVNLAFGAGPAVVDQGFPCDAAVAVGRQGGGLFFDNPVTTLVDVFAISAAGTNLVVLKG